MMSSILTDFYPKIFNASYHFVGISAEKEVPEGAAVNVNKFLISVTRSAKTKFKFTFSTAVYCNFRRYSVAYIW